MLNYLLGAILERLPENNRFERIWKLAQVDFRKRYYNTQMGLVWALLNPISRLLIYYFVFTYLGSMDRENFALYIFGALVLWMSFTEATGRGIDILGKKKYLLENIQFDKLDLYISSNIAVFLALAFNLLAYLIISFFIIGIPIFIEIIWLPLLLLNLFVLCLGVSMILSTINIYFKDIKHLWSILMMLGFWTIPSIFPLESFKGPLKMLLYINPVGGIIINTRNALMYGEPMEISFLIHCWIYAIVLYFIGKGLMERNWQNSIERA